MANFHNKQVPYDKG